MANITARLLKINGTDIANISEYEVQYSKLWKDADRNMAGDVRATFIGVFPKIVAKTAPQPLDKAQKLVALLNTPYFSVEFFDTVTGSTKTAQYYAGDVSTKLLQRSGSIMDEISFSLIPVSRQ